MRAEGVEEEVLIRAAEVVTANHLYWSASPEADRRVTRDETISTCQVLRPVGILLMRQALSILLIWLMLIPLAPKLYGSPDAASQIRAIPPGAHIEVRLKSKEKMRGKCGPLTDAGFALLDEQSGEHQIAFDQVATVKQLGPHKSHTVRNVLIVAAVGVAIFGIVLGIELRCGPLGCNPKI